MGHKANQRIFFSTDCHHSGGSCRPGAVLIRQLHAAIGAAGAALGDDFAISGLARMSGCQTPCTLAYRADKKAAYLFGDIAPGDDIEALVAFARRCHADADGWACAEAEAKAKTKTQKPGDHALARLPAMIMAADFGPVQ